MTSTLKSAELPLETGTEAHSAAKFTQEQARQWLTANPNTGKTIRDIAAIWGWSKSTTQRFLSHGTNAKHGANFGETGGTNGTSGTVSEPPEGRVLGRTPSGTVVAAMPDASDLDDGPPIFRAPYRDDFDWAED